ncbi:MAG: autotransporter outer membrane beta-barrel domain-containing protein [Nitrospirae bacterium]|nr:autotransporter outer membrane beta-barrel domain-containing protein [Nitrospirota bacterium]
MKSAINRHRFLVVLSVMLLLGLHCNVVRAADSDIYLKIESFTWTEYDDQGTRLLKESGPIYTIGSSVRSDLSGALFLGVNAELFGGTVGYDGQTQAGVPVETDTDYTGFVAEGDLGWKVHLRGKATLEPFAGLGYRWWRRDIKDTVSAIGYEETWWSLYARLGAQGEYAYTEKVTVFGKAGLKIPVITENEVDLSIIGLSTVKVEPGNVTSVFAEAGVKWTRFEAGLFYEGMRFSKSDPVTVGGAQVWQPETKADMFGIKLGMDL